MALPPGRTSNEFPVLRKCGPLHAMLIGTSKSRRLTTLWTKEKHPKMIQNGIFKIALLSLILTSISSCWSTLFEMKEQHLIGYKINDTTSIELYYVNLGATSSNLIHIRRKVPGQEKNIAIIKGFDDTYLIDIKQVDDSILNITFTDTSSYWKGKSRDFLVNINNKQLVIQD